MTSAPQWIERWSYVVTPLATLPTPETLNRPACMTRRVPPWRRTYRRLVPSRGGRGCCWYHGGDWHRVNATAIRLVAQAHAAGATGLDVGDHVVAAARAEGLSGWQLEALESLLVIEPVRIELGGDPADRWYDNGRHRVTAMLDAGVRRTIVGRLELLDPATGQPLRN
ncbi:hypothetical protein [Pseudofrankia asymbiotica]|uniref:Uncharacterized protein n=1 Tax=Pseudofrankia asymbiotica TaxID=1834516 RepID=A0A1V2IIN4_9ACTN|nr:hypothetical protein [Pseudofrankia asymbiotica]ONH32840.1 hypothetical protein BL253_03730 [Pseudofrankia asymbiotica]